MPSRRPDDDDDDDDPDDRPRRRRDDPDDRDDDRPRRRRDAAAGPPPKTGGGGRLLLILLLVAGGGLVLCCGGCGLIMYFAAGKQVTVLDATRTKSPQGGTASATVNVRIGPDSPGGFVRGDYYFMFKSGGRTSVHNIGLQGRGGGEYKSMFFTPELVNEPGAVEFWVERRDKDSVFQVSPVHTIP